MKTKQLKQKQIKSKEKKICFRCKNVIVPDARHVDLITLDKGIIIEALHWHITCWGEYNQERVNQRLNEMARTGMKLIKPMLNL